MIRKGLLRGFTGKILLALLCIHAVPAMARRISADMIDASQRQATGSVLPDGSASQDRNDKADGGRFMAAAGTPAQNPAGATGASPEKERATPGAVILVLDASGSMWGQIQGRAKIEIAREVISDLLNHWDKSIHLGLMAYGHRLKGDCNDIEILIPVGEADPGAIMAAINAINPKGKTPLSEAVRRAAVALRYTEERATVVLVSDGVETCDADPCAVGAELAMSGVDFTAHVIGFDVKDEEQTGLRCLAEKTGGLFLAATDAAGLRDALFQTVAKVKEAPAPVVEEPGDARVKAPAKVPAGSGFEVVWEGPDSRNDFITIVEKNAPKEAYHDYAYTSRGNPVPLTAPDRAGAYEVRYIFGHTKAILASTDVTVTPVEASLKAPAEVAAGAMFDVHWQGPNNRGDYVTIVAAGTPDGKYANYAYTASGNPVSLQASDKPGDYEVRYMTGQTNSVLARGGVTVKPVSAKVEVPAEVAAGSNFDVHWQGPNNRGDYITIVPANAPDSEYMSYAYTSSGSPGNLQAPHVPGVYEVRYISDQSRTALTRVAMTVNPVSAKVETPAEVPAGTTFEVRWDGPNYRGDYITIVPVNDPDSDYMSYAYTAKGSPASLKAPDKSGNYEVRYILDQSRTALARSPVTVK